MARAGLVERGGDEAGDGVRGAFRRADGGRGDGPRADGAVRRDDEDRGLRAADVDADDEVARGPDHAAASPTARPSSAVRRSAEAPMHDEVVDRRR